MSDDLKLIILDVWHHIILSLALPQIPYDEISFLPWLHLNMANICAHWTKLILKCCASVPADTDLCSFDWSLSYERNQTNCIIYLAVEEYSFC